MAYDEALAARIRAAVAGRKGVTEKQMFGGIGFMLDGNMLAGVMSKGGMLVRVGAAGHEAAIGAPHTGPFQMGKGKPMAGYVIVSPAGVTTPGAVASWIERAWAHVRTLPPKIAGAPKKSMKKKIAAPPRAVAIKKKR